MSRIDIPTLDQAPEASKPLLAAVQQQLGMVPNLMKVVGLSPAALEGYLSLNGALAKGKLSVALRERIALSVAEFNGCSYCLSAHTYLGQHVAKLSSEDIAAARDHHSSDPKSAAALRFAHRVAADRGRVSADDLANLRAAGFDDASVIEIVLTVALNVLTNYVNNVVETTVDFPLIPAKSAR